MHWFGNKVIRLALIELLAVLLSAPSWADVVGVATVTDGDTLKISGERIRIFGIDALDLRARCLSKSARRRPDNVLFYVSSFTPQW